jgi:NMD protein affecting ribosome stability and mRNA decay
MIEQKLMRFAIRGGTLVCKKCGSKFTRRGWVKMSENIYKANALLDSLEKSNLLSVPSMLSGGKNIVTPIVFVGELPDELKKKKA